MVIHQLPKTSETLWFRLLGRDRVLSTAIEEVAALESNHPFRQDALSWLGNLKVILEAKQIREPEEEVLMMQLSPLYLEKIQQAELVGEAKGETRMVVRLLNRRLGEIPPQYLTKIQRLTVSQLEDLGEALLDFTTLPDLESWLSKVDN